MDAWVWLGVSVVLAGVLLFYRVAPGWVERALNPVVQPPAAVSSAALALHGRLRIADLHTDSLLWGRDLLARSGRGHADIPRLLAGNVALQVLTVVTKTPRHQNIDHNDDCTDNILPLAVAQRWPMRCWGSLCERCLYQSRRLHDMARRAGGRLVLIKSQADLRAYLLRRQREPGIVAALLGIEGAHALDGDLANLERLYAAGFRLMSPSHFFDTDIGGSAHGMEQGGLTDKGRQWLAWMEAHGMVVDLAHASGATLDDVLRLARKPVIVSHTGVKGTCANARNLSDVQLEAVAANGGLVGIGFWDTATGGNDVAAIVRALRYTVDHIGARHVALGSDWDGAVAVPFDAARLAELTDGLLGAGFSEDEIASIMGENVLRYLDQVLPPG